MPRSVTDDTLLSTRQLKERGIRFSRQWLHKLAKRGDFPRPVHLGEKTVAYWQSDIDTWLAARSAS
jgi:prophage regulatory protein